MCSGRVDPAHLLRAFSQGADGVLIGGCRLSECNYTTHGNYHALNLVLLFKKILAQSGLNPARLRLFLMSGSEGNLFVEAMHDFVQQVQELGPLGQGEGLDISGLKIKLQAAAKLVPYLRLVENERLKVHFATWEEYEEFYAGEELAALFQELIADKLAISQIILLLRERPLSTGEIARILGLTPSEVARHLHSSARQGLIRYEEDRKCFALA